MGVDREVLQPGFGRSPKAGEVVVAHYVGKLASTGAVFDSSRARNKPLTFMIGIGSVIRGWDEGIIEMSLGETAVLTISSDFGYW